MRAIYRSKMQKPAVDRRSMAYGLIHRPFSDYHLQMSRSDPLYSFMAYVILSRSMQHIVVYHSSRHGSDDRKGDLCSAE